MDPYKTHTKLGSIKGRPFTPVYLPLFPSTLRVPTTYLSTLVHCCEIRIHSQISHTNPEASGFTYLELYS